MGSVVLFLAQEEGFEPPCLLGKRFSRPPRCDRFDIPAYIWCGSLHHIYAVLFRSGSWNSFHESASHTPRRCVKLACKQRVRVSSTEIILRCSKSSYRLFIWTFELIRPQNANKFFVWGIEYIKQAYIWYHIFSWLSIEKPQKSGRRNIFLKRYWQNGKQVI